MDKTVELQEIGMECELNTDCYYKKYRSAADGNIELSNKIAKLKKENEILRKNLEEKCILPDTIADIAHMKEVESLRSQLDFMEKTHKTLLEQLRQKEEECEELEKQLKHEEEMNIKLAKESVRVNDKLKQVLDEIEKTIQSHDSIPCEDVYADCYNCKDEVTDCGETCMKKGLDNILQIIQKVKEQ